MHCKLTAKCSADCSRPGCFAEGKQFAIEEKKEKLRLRTARMRNEVGIGISRKGRKNGTLEYSSWWLGRRGGQERTSMRGKDGKVQGMKGHSK